MNTTNDDAVSRGIEDSDTLEKYHEDAFIDSGYDYFEPELSDVNYDSDSDFGETDGESDDDAEEFNLNNTEEECQYPQEINFRSPVSSDSYMEGEGTNPVLIARQDLGGGPYIQSLNP
jgi:hypothetical protein